MWPFYKTYKIDFLRGRYSRIPASTYIRANSIPHAVKKLKRHEWPTEISIEYIARVEEN